jgi:hypothetical protein
MRGGPSEIAIWDRILGSVIFQLPPVMPAEIKYNRNASR